MQLQGKLQDAQQQAQRAPDAAQAADEEWDQLRVVLKELEARRPKG